MVRTDALHRHPDWDPISSVSDSAATLCADCAKIDLHSLRDQTIDPGLFKPVRNLGIIVREPSATCSMCRLFTDIWWMWGCKLSEDDQAVVGLVCSSSLRKYHIYSTGKTQSASLEVKHPLSDSSLTRHRGYHRPAFLVQRWNPHLWQGEERRLDWRETSTRFSYDLTTQGCVFFNHVDQQHTQTSLSANLTSPTTIEWPELRKWIESCRNNHYNCSPEPQARPPGFRLIDCRSRRTFLTDPHQTYGYAALSYTWGTAATEPAGVEEPIMNLPQTIADAITVTLELGLQYLWVDRYCVPSDDAELKHAQISAMDVVYMGAEVTIVQAEGADASVGLCGISSSRSRQPRVRIGDYQLASTFPEPELHIKSSPWFHRGWTYQEGILSRRCLYFTKQQVYFECREATFHESIREPNPFLAGQILYRPSLLAETPTMETDVIGGIYRVFPAVYLQQVEADAYLLAYRLIEYTNRHLTFDSDALNAFLGILRRFRHPLFNISHLWGVPILWSTNSDWSFVQGFAAGLCWDGYSSHRRPGFPSWSWTAWRRGAVTNADMYYHGIQCAPDFQIQLEATSGDILDWDAYNDYAVSSNAPVLGPFIHVSGWMIHCKLVRVWRQHDHSRVYLRIRNDNGCFWASTRIYFEGSIEVEEFEHQDEEESHDALPYFTDFSAYYRPRWQEYQVGRDGQPLKSTVFDQSMESVNGYKDWPVLVLGDPGAAMSLHDTSSHEDDTHPKRRPRGAFLIVLQQQEGYYKRLIGVDISQENIDTDSDMQHDDGTQLSDYFVGATRCRIRLG